MTYLSPIISKRLQGQIWKMEVDPLGILLFVECRDIDNKLAKFYSFDLKHGRVCFDNLITEERWLTGIEGSYNGILFLHGYQSPQSPVHKGITGVDGKTGKVLWIAYNVAIHHISVNGPIAFNTQISPVRLMLFDALNGATLRSFNPLLDQDIDVAVKIPIVIDELDEVFESYVKGNVVGNVHYMEYNNFRIVSLHARVEGDMLTQVLLIIAGGTLVYDDLINDKIQKLQPEAFIMHQNQLVYIKDKVELKVLNL